MSADPRTPCMLYAQLVQICGGVAPTLPHYERTRDLVWAYVPRAITVVQLGEVAAQIQHLWPGTSYQLVFVADIPADRLTEGWATPRKPRK